jgi:hypothetical protein
MTSVAPTLTALLVAADRGETEVFARPPQPPSGSGSWLPSGSGFA